MPKTSVSRSLPKNHPMLNSPNTTNYPFNIQGLSTKKSEFDQVICTIETEQIPELETLNSLFEHLPESLEIFFFDHFHPTISDPGAYVSVRKQNGKLYYWLGNHGWSSSRYWTTPNYCAKYLLKNWSYNKDTLRVSVAFGSINSENIETEKLWEYQLTEVEKSPWNYVLYEANGNLLLSVLSGSVGLFDVNILLHDQQQQAYKTEGSSLIEAIAKEIRENPNKFAEQHIEIRVVAK